MILHEILIRSKNPATLFLLTRKVFKFCYFMKKLMSQLAVKQKLISNETSKIPPPPT